MAKTYRREKIEKFIQKLEIMKDEPFPKPDANNKALLTMFDYFLRYREELLYQIIGDMKDEFDLWDEEDKT